MNTDIETQFQPIAHAYGALEEDKVKSRYELVVNWPSIMQMLPKPPAKVLDYGCGAGTYARLLMAAGYEVLAVDNAADMISQLQGLTARVWSYQDEPLSERFDCIVAKLVVQFVEDLPAFARAMQRQLVPGGCVLVSVPNPERSRALAGDAKSGRYLTSIGVSDLRVTMIHREKAEYISVFADAGFELASAVEPRDSDAPGDQSKRLNMLFRAS